MRWIGVVVGVLNQLQYKVCVLAVEIFRQSFEAAAKALLLLVHQTLAVLRQHHVHTKLIMSQRVDELAASMQHVSHIDVDICHVVIVIISGLTTFICRYRHHVSGDFTWAHTHAYVQST